jgi:hypothetical protein
MTYQPPTVAGRERLAHLRALDALERRYPRTESSIGWPGHRIADELSALPTTEEQYRATNRVMNQLKKRGEVECPHLRYRYFLTDAGRATLAR